MTVYNDPVEFAKMMHRLETQNKEFDALTVLASHWTRLRQVPVVDNDYPKVRYEYESACKAFFIACKAFFIACKAFFIACKANGRTMRD